MNGNKKTTLRNDNKAKQSHNSVLIDMILNNPESKMRVAIKETEEQVKDESKKRRLRAPITTEEKIFLKT